MVCMFEMNYNTPKLLSTWKIHIYIINPNLRKITGSFIKLKGQKRKNAMKDFLAYLMIKQQIFGLDVSMNHIFLMTKRQRLREAQNVLKFTRDTHKDTKFDKKQWIKQEERTRKPALTKHIKVIINSHAQHKKHSTYSWSKPQLSQHIKPPPPPPLKPLFQNFKVNNGSSID